MTNTRNRRRHTTMINILPKQSSSLQFSPTHQAPLDATYVIPSQYFKLAIFRAVSQSFEHAHHLRLRPEMRTGTPDSIVC